MTRASAAETPLLEVRDLSVSYGSGPYGSGPCGAPALAEVTLQLAAGEVLAVVGESGAGKSTLASALLGLIAPPARIVTGEVRLSGRPLPVGDERALRRIRGRQIGLVVQDTLASLDPLCSVGGHLVETVRSHFSIERKEAWDRALDAVRRVGIPEPELRLRQYPHQLSGGMRQRLVVALALAGEPEVIVADEPTTNLDAPRKRRILDLLTTSCRARGMGLIIVSHDVGLVATVADRIAVMRAGRIVETGSASEVLGAPRHPYTRALLAAVPQVCRPRAATRSRADTETRPAAKLAKAWLLGERATGRDRPPHPAPDAAHDPSPARAPDGPSDGPLLELRDITVAFDLKRSWLPAHRRSQRAVDAVSLDLAPGETLGLVGESGSGKSTLARVAAGLLRPSPGAAWFAGEELLRALAGRDRLRVRREIQMVFQDPYFSLNARWRVYDIVAEPLRIHHLTRDRSEERAVVEGLLAIVDLDADAVERSPHQFSAGQCQRIAIARALAARPRVLICDEPTSALDVVAQERVLRLLEELGREIGLTILLISHDLAVIRRICDRVAVMREGRLCEIGATEGIFRRPIHPYTRELISLLPPDLPVGADTPPRPA